MSGVSAVAPEERLSAVAKLFLTAEILAEYARARRAMRHRELLDAAEVVGDAGDRAARCPYDSYGAGLRLGAAVTRVLRALPRDPRCLAKSLVLTALLARRGIPSTLVIGVRSAPFAAHAWVEYDGRPLLPPATTPFERLLEVVTWPR